MKIVNCPITGQTSEVLKFHVDSNKDPLYTSYRGYHTGVDLSGSKVYSLFPGVVVHTNKDEYKYSCIISFDSCNYFMYSNLKSLNVKRGDVVDTSQLIGECDKFVHVDYLTLEQTKWPVRIGQVTFYKHDPLKYISEGYGDLINYYAVKADDTVAVYPSDDELPPQVLAEFTDSRG